MKQTIAIISNLYPPYHRGGAEIIAKNMAEAFVNNGDFVHIITTTPKKESISKENGLSIFRFNPKNIFFYTKDYKYPFFIRCIWHAIDLLNIYSAYKQYRYLKSIKPDYIISHNLISMSYFLPIIASLLGVKQIHIIHDIQLAKRSGVFSKNEKNQQKYFNILENTYCFFTKQLFSPIDVIISPSHFLLDFYKQKSFFKNSQNYILRNPISDRFFLETNNHVSKSPSVIEFGCVSQLTEHKGLLLLKEAWNSFETYLNEHNILAHLSIVGAGELQEDMMKWANNNESVTFKGKLDQKELPDFYHSLNYLIMPSLTIENSPTVILESLASKTPVLTFNLGGSAEMIQEGKNGYSSNQISKQGLLTLLKKSIQLPIIIKNRDESVNSSLQYIKKLKKII